MFTREGCGILKLCRCPCSTARENEREIGSCSTSCSAATVNGLHESLFVEYRELVHCLAPLLGRATPVRRDVAQRQPDQFGGRLIRREMSARLDDLAQLRVHALDRVRGVDDAANLRRERKERDDVSPRSALGIPQRKQYCSEVNIGLVGSGL